MVPLIYPFKCMTSQPPSCALMAPGALPLKSVVHAYVLSDPRIEVNCTPCYQSLLWNSAAQSDTTEQQPQLPASLSICI